MNREKITVVMSSDNNQAFALANVIIDLKRYNDDLVHKIYIYHDIDQKIRECIKKIWPEVIEFIEYKYANFLKDIEYKLSDIPLNRKYGHFIFSKYYVFKHINHFGGGVLWLDCDVLVTGNISSFLIGDNDFFWRMGDRTFAYEYLNEIGINCSLRDVAKPNGGMIFVKNTILQKIKEPQNLTHECFSILLDLFKRKILKQFSQADEIPFAVLQRKYRLSAKDSKGVANVFPGEDKNNALIVHTPNDIKFWKNPCAFFIYQEWFVNHKIWINKYFSKDHEIEFTFESYKSHSECYNKLLYSWLFDAVYNDILLFCENIFKQFYFYQKENYLDIKFKDEAYVYRILLKTWAPLYCRLYEIQLIFKDADNYVESLLLDMSSEYEFFRKDDKNKKISLYLIKPKVKYDKGIFLNELERFILFTYPKIQAIKTIKPRRNS